MADFSKNNKINKYPDTIQVKPKAIKITKLLLLRYKEMNTMAVIIASQSLVFALYTVPCVLPPDSSSLDEPVSSGARPSTQWCRALSPHCIMTQWQIQIESSALLPTLTQYFMRK